MPTPNTATQPAARTLPPGIEIFRPGRHVDDQGVARDFSAADMHAIAAAYDPAVRQAPLTVGHPAHDLPAYGWVGKCAVNAAGRLTMDATQVDAQFAEMVAAGRFSKRSVAFYPPAHLANPKPGTWYPRHVAFLGAQPPAVSGLKDIQFADPGQGLVCFSEVPDGADSTTGTTATTDTTEGTDPMTTELQAQLAAATAKADKAAADLAAANATIAAAQAEAAAATTKLANFAEAQRTERHAAHVSFAQGQQQAGKLRTTDVAAAVAVLDLLADSAPVQFGEGDNKASVSPVQWVKDRIAAAAPLVNFSEQMPGNAGGAGAQGAPLNDAELHTRATAYAAQKNVSYSEALDMVASFTTTAA